MREGQLYCHLTCKEGLLMMLLMMIITIHSFLSDHSSHPTQRWAVRVLRAQSARHLCPHFDSRLWEGGEVRAGHLSCHLTCKEGLLMMLLMMIITIHSCLSDHSSHPT